MIRLLVAAGIALAVSIVGTRFLIGWLTRRRVASRYVRMVRPAT